MKLTADKTGGARRFYAKLGWGEKFDSMELKLISAHTVPALVPPLAVQGRRNHIIQYDISAYTTLEYYLTNILSRDQYAELLLQVLEVFRQMQHVYLNFANLVLEPNKMFIQLSDRSIHLIYLPLLNSKREASLPDFFRRIIKISVRSTYEQAAFLDACQAWLDRPVSFIPDEFERFIRESSRLESKGPSCACEQGPKRDAPGRGVCDGGAAKADRFVSPLDIASENPSGAAQGGTVPLCGGMNGATVPLDDTGAEPSSPRAILMRMNSQEQAVIDRTPFLVGAGSGSVDYYVSNNPKVSRLHAQFTIENGTFFICDQKSMNKTYVNDGVLVPNVPVELHNGDRIRMANENFVFTREE